MTQAQANCPACGGRMTFKHRSALVTVCEFCQSVVARSDRKLEDFGKIAPLVDSDSPLERGLSGSIAGRTFELVGRIQFEHASGGTWTEWYALFHSGRWAWIAEAQGKLYLTFEKKLPSRVVLPKFEELPVGEDLVLADTEWVVVEQGSATPIAAEGEIPFLFRPTEAHLYADLEGAGKQFASISYSDDEPTFYAGKEVTYAQLGWAKLQPAATTAVTVGSVQINCPQCAGPLTLQAPDTAERVVCPSCKSLLDASGGKLAYLKTLALMSAIAVEPVIPLGRVGAIAGQRYIVIGFLQRSVTYDKDYFWTEYLLYDRAVGYRWLVHSDGHWSFVGPISAADVSRDASVMVAYKPVVKAIRYNGQKFSIFQMAEATVRHLSGEFYWKVELGERVMTADYIAPPKMISSELNISYKQGKPLKEVIYSLGSYLTREEVAAAFGNDLLPKFPPTQGVAPNQPIPQTGIYSWWLLAVAALIVLAVVLVGTITPKTLFHETVKFEPLTGRPPAPVIEPAAAGPAVSAPGQPGAGGPTIEGQPAASGAAAAASIPASIVSPDGTMAMYFSETPLRIVGARNIQIEVSAALNNSWMFVAGSLYNTDTGLVQTFEIPAERYSGVDGGEAWEEGGNSASTFLSALPAGEYKLNLGLQCSDPASPPLVTVIVRQGVIRWSHFFLALFFISVVPFFVFLYHWRLHYLRWKDSEFSPYQNVGNSDSDDGDGDGD